MLRVRASLMALPLLGLLACGGGSPLNPNVAAGASGGAAAAAAGAVGAASRDADAAGGGGSARPDAGPDVPSATDGGSDSATLPGGACVLGAFKHDGVCLCQNVAPTVCGKACVDLTTDDDNCGACGHTCAPTSACNAGACGPQVVNVVPDSPGCQQINLAVGVSTLYWTDRGHGTVTSQPVAGGALATIASGEASPSLIALGATDVFWVDVVSATPVAADAGLPSVSTTATIRAVALAGGAPRDLVTETNLSGGVRGLVASEDGRTLYYSAGNAVRAVPAAGGPAFDVGREERGYAPTALARAGNMIAFAADLSGEVYVVAVVPGVVASCGKPDPTAILGTDGIVEVNCTRATRGGPEPFQNGLVVRSDGVYWAESGDIDVYRPPDGGMLVVDGSTTQSTGGGKVTITRTAAENDVTALVGGPDALYFGEDGLIEKAPYVEGSLAIVLARGQKAPGSIALGATTIFWSSPDDCTINGLAR
jgi:hypothetical protein